MYGKKRNSQYHIKGELYEVDDEDFKKANQIELNAGYKLKEIDKGIFGYIYPKRVDIKSTMVNTNAKKKYYEWTHLGSLFDQKINSSNLF